MSILIQPLTEQWTEAVKALNLRLAAHSIDRLPRFPETPPPSFNGSAIQEERFVATEEEHVRGGFILRHQQFSVHGEVCTVGHYRLPLSEGIVSKPYAALGVQMLKSALKRRPLLFALGMGGVDRPLPRMLRSMGWRVAPVPFFIKLCRPARVLREIRPLRRHRALRAAMDLAALSGLGAMGIRALQMRYPRRSAGIELTGDFGEWADRLWQSCAGRQALCAVRDRETLNSLYPPGNPRFLRLRVTDRTRVAGWAVVLDTQMRNDRYFGSLRVGTIADCLSLPPDAGLVARAATRFLEERGADLIVSNQAGLPWRGALAKAGFLRAPSNFVLAVSRQLGERIGRAEDWLDGVHINRGDGDGPVHL